MSVANQLFLAHGSYDGSHFVQDQRLSHQHAIQNATKPYTEFIPPITVIFYIHRIGEHDFLGGAGRGYYPHPTARLACSISLISAVEKQHHD